MGSVSPARWRDLSAGALSLLTKPPLPLHRPGRRGSREATRPPRHALSEGAPARPSGFLQRPVSLRDSTLLELGAVQSRRASGTKAPNAPAKLRGANAIVILSRASRTPSAS